MTCYRPICCWRSREGRNENGKWPVVFQENLGYSDYKLYVPCHQCIGCRLDYRLGWAVRLMHELQFHQEAIFCTFTYSPENLPENGSLFYRDFQLFMKRLRKYVSRGTSNIKYYCAGEYGDLKCRPHYHAIIFGFRPVDSILLSCTGLGHFLYTSPILQNLWGLGFIDFGDVTFESCGYVAGYIQKKLSGHKIEEYVIPETGELKKREFSACSKGLGLKWIEKYYQDITNNGYLLYNGHKCPVPAYYENWIEQNDYDSYLTYLNNRSKILSNKSYDNFYGDYGPDRLADREKAVNYRVSKRLPRPLDASFQ